MSENLHDIDKLFRDGIDGHEEAPQEKLWDAVDASLDKSNVINIKRKYNNLKKVAAVLLLLLMSVAGYEIFKTKSGGDQTAVNDKKAAAVVNQKEHQQQNIIAEKKSNANNQHAIDSANTANTANENIPDKIINTSNEAANTTGNSFKVSNTGKQKIDKPWAKEKNEYVENVPGNINTKNSYSKLKKNNETGEEGESNDNTAKRSNAAKTKIKIKKPSVSDTDEVMENDEANLANTATTKWLVNDKAQAATLARRINKAIAQNELLIAARNTPDVTIKKIKAAKSLKFSIMPFASPQFAFATLKEESKPGNQTPGGPPPPRPGRDNHKEQYKNDEEIQTSFSTGVLGEIVLGKKWSLQSGIIYTAKKITIEPKKIYAQPDKDGQVKYVFDCSSGYSYLTGKTGTSPVAGDSINASSSKNSLAYIGIPLMVNYKITAGKFNIKPTAGAIVNLLTKQRIETELQQGTSKLPQTINKIEGLKSKYLNATLGLALEYDINNKMAVNIMPMANFALTSINKDAGVKSYPNAFGIAGGLKFKF